jgi:cytochrome c oxidase subunit II
MKKIGMLAGAAVLFAALSACGSNNTAGTAASASPSAADTANAQKLNIVATNWKFDQPEYHIKKGQPVTVTLKNESGVHGIELEKLGVKLDNKTTTKTFTPDKAGKYTISCTIPCGTDHLKMKSVLIVDE